MLLTTRWLALGGLIVLTGCAPRALRTPSILDLERSAAQPMPREDISSLERAMMDDYADNGRLDKFTLAQAALVVSGATDMEGLRAWQLRYQELRGLIAKRLSRDRLLSEQAQARRVFHTLHDTVLTVYRVTQSSVLTLLEDGSYNCVSATLIFNALLEDLGIRTAAVDLPSHTYSVLWADGKRLEVETTHALGFEPFRNEEEYRAFLRSRGLRVGVDTADPVLVKGSVGQRTVDNRILLSYVYTNRAAVAADMDHMQEAWRNYRRAAALVPGEAEHVFNRDALLHNLALEYLEKRQPTRAMRILLAAARMGEGGALPERLKRLLVHTYGRLGELAAERGDTEELERIFVSGISRLPGEPKLRQMESAWIQEAAVRLAEEEQRVEAAVALLLRHLEGSPVRKALLHTCAVLAVNEANRRSREGSPRRGEVLLDRVLEDLRRAGAPSDQVGMVQAGLGNMRFAMEYYPEAAQSWRAALALGWDPDGSTRNNLFAALLNQAVRASNTGDCGTATHFAREALGVIPSDGQALRILTRCGL